LPSEKPALAKLTRTDLPTDAEVRKYLRQWLQTYIAPAAAGFVRVYAEQTYGIPPEQVVADGDTYGYDKDANRS